MSKDELIEYCHDNPIAAAERIAELEARLDAVKEEVQRIDEVFFHPDTTSYEAYTNIRSIVDQLRKALGGDDVN